MHIIARLIAQFNRLRVDLFVGLMIRRRSQILANGNAVERISR